MLSSTRLIAQRRLNLLPARQSILPRIRPVQCIQRCQWLTSTSRHHDSSNTTVAPKTTPSPLTRTRFPEVINVFLGSAVKTAWSGVIRVVGIGAWLYGWFSALPALYFADQIVLWHVPALLLGSPIPFYLICALTGPYVSSIRAYLPGSARHSKEGLQHFAANIPPSTRMEIKFIRCVPWFNTRVLQFRELRRIQKTGRLPSLVNLEHFPRLMSDAKKSVLKEGGFKVWLVRRYMGQFWVDLPGDRSNLPGVMQNIWKQIPPVDGKPIEDEPASAPKRVTPTAVNNREEGGGRVIEKRPPPPPKRHTKRPR